MFVSNDVIQSSGVGFGTSGARGLVTQFTTNVCAAFTHAFVAVMAENFKFERIALAIDNRPSSYAMAQACAAALKQRNIEPVYYGVIPTPALAYSAMQQNIPCIMVTGSHIPFDRNGLKFYRPDGEITKLDEEAIISSEVEFESLSELAELGVDNTASTMYIERYTSMFSSDMLSGKRIGIYEHSSAGRDIYADLFSAMGAEVISLERTDKFVPIDTEAVAEADFVKSRTWANEHKLDAIFSTDGDGDRPLVSDENGEWLRGDMLGLLTAAKLGIDALAIPVSCNTAIEASNAFKYIKRTRIGSPYVIAELEQLSHSYNAIAGFEANGGFLLGCDIDVNGKVLKALPTRDAVLPAIILLAAVGDKTVSMLVDSLPKRFTSSNRIQNFATKRSSEIIATGVKQPDTLLAKLGFNGLLASIDITDGLRMILVDGRIIHLRPSGNAPELRCYAEASDIHTAQLLVRQTLEKVQRYIDAL